MKNGIFLSVLLLAGTLKAEQFAPVQVFEFKANPRNKTTNINVNVNGLATIDPNKEQEQAFDKLKKAIVDKSQNDDEVYGLFDSWFDSWKTPGLDYVNFRPLDDLMAKNRPPYFAPLVKGRYYIEAAWQWRGGDYADKVTVLQWQQFAEKLKTAKESLDQAWKLDSTKAVIANEMLAVELGQGTGRDQMELWFQRAMSLDTNNYCACQRKLLYLEPKWYGSKGQMTLFGAECLESTNWGGKVPLIVVDAHRAMINYLPANARSTYWQQPTVWMDVKRAFEKYLEGNPKDTKERQRYAAFAYAALQWETLNEQMPLLGTIDFKIFGGAAAYQKMVITAKQHSAKSNQ
jgi:hypothetical protein